MLKKRKQYNNEFKFRVALPSVSMILRHQN